MYKIFLFNDTFRNSRLCTMINREDLCGLTIVGETCNILEAYESIINTRPDIIITDVAKDEISGCELIEKLKTSDYDAEYIVLSGNNRIEYAKRALESGASEYLFRPFSDEDVINAIKRVMVRVNEKKQFLIYKFRVDNFMSVLKELCIDKKVFEFIVNLNIRNFVAYNVCVLENSAKQKMCREALEILLNNVTRKAFEICVFQVKDKIAVVVAYNQPGKLEEHRTELIFKIREYTCLYNPQALFFTGKLVWSLDELWASFVDADRKIDYCNYMNMGMEEIPEDFCSEVDEVLSKLAEAFLNSIFNSSEDSSKFTVCGDKLFRAFKDKYISQEVIKILCTDFMYELKYRLKYENQMIMNDIINIDFDIAQYISSLKTVTELKSFIFSITLRVVQYIKMDNNNYKKNLISEIKDYVNRNFAGAITLGDISTNMHLSSAYISHIFKSETGKTLFCYITQSRIQEARRLLSDTNLKIADIAKMVGYGSQKHFCQVFRRVTGKTAGECRKASNCAV